MNKLDNLEFNYPVMNSSLLNGMTNVNGSLDINGTLTINGNLISDVITSDEVMKIREMLNDWERNKYPERFL